MGTHKTPFSILLSMCLGVTVLLGQMGEAVKPVPAAEARTMIGTNAVIVGKVAEVYKTEKVTRLNFEEKYPKQTFTAVVFARNYNVFTNLDALTGKTVEISGKVQEYRGKPEVILNSRGQMRVLATESAGKAEK